MGGGWVGSGVPSPEPADVPGKGEGVLPMRVWVPIEEQGLQEMAKDAEMAALSDPAPARVDDCEVWEARNVLVLRKGA